jgi:lycopene cyclase domain-containing protein
MRRLLFGVLPFVYVPAFVFAPIALLNTDYGWSVVLLFWVPAAILYTSLFRKLDRKEHIAFWGSVALMLPVTFAFEYVCLVLDVWSFDQSRQKLWGLWIGPAPVEEFIFWFGATPFCLMVYCWYRCMVFTPWPRPA